MIVKGTAQAWRRAGFALVAVAFGAATQAQSLADLQALGQQWLQSEVVRAGGAFPVALRYDVQVSEPDSRLRLAQCGNVEFYQPAGARLWGRTRIAARCVDGMARWNIGMQANVRALGAAWVLRNPISVGAPIADTDVVQAEVDWAAEQEPVLTDSAQWSGQLAARPLQAGQVLRRNMVKPAFAFQSGATVRVIAQGVGFQVSGEGQALTAGIVGQSARVRMEGGRVSSGIVLDARTVRIDL